MKKLSLLMKADKTMDHKSFLARVLGSNYKTLSGYDIIKYIDKELKSRGTELGLFQKEVLRDAWAGEYGCLPFEAFEWKAPEGKKINILWRLSIIPLGIWIVLLFLFIPVKWVFTGKPHYGGGKIGKFTAGWIDKVCGR